MIKFVYFDVGGVVIRDFEKTDKWAQMKRDLGVTQDEDQCFNLVWNEYKDRIATNFDVNDLPSIITQRCGILFPESYLMMNDFISRFEQNKSIWQVIADVKKKCKIGLLTDMYPMLLHNIEVNGLLPKIEWDVIVDSSKVGVRKPNQEIYKIAQEKAEVQPNELLFIDNLEKNLTVPNMLGWHTFLYDSANYEKSSKKLRDFLTHVGLL